MAAKANIILHQGADFVTSFYITDVDGDAIDLTGYTGRSQMRKEYTSNTAYNFTVTVTEAIGKVELSMTSAVSANIVADKYVYDCELVTAANVVSRIIEGTVTVTPEVTRT